MKALYWKQRGFKVKLPDTGCDVEAMRTELGKIKGVMATATTDKWLTGGISHKITNWRFRQVKREVRVVLEGYNVICKGEQAGYLAA